MKEKSKHMNIPKIRFKGFEDTWKNDKIGNIGSVLMCKRIFKSQTTSIGDIPFYKIGTFGSTADAFISENLFNEYKTRFSYPQYGDILLSAAGTIGRIVEYKGEKAYFQDSNIVWVKVNGKIKNQFLKYIYSCIKWNGLEGSTIKRLYNNNILETAINYPSPEEQQKIASYFQSLDSLIQTISKKLASLKRIKAASLQSMFPQEGETVPKVRFKGFEREWEPVKLSKIGYMTAGGTPSTFVDKYWNGEINWLQSGIVQNRIIYTSSVERKITAEGLSNSAAHMIKKDSVLIAITGATCANIGYLTFESAANQSVVSIEPNNNFYSKFIYSSLISERSQILSFKGGSAQSGVTLANLKEILLKCPSFGEQVFIGDYFFSLEKNIELLTQRLEKLKQIKAACLDKMFV